MLSMYAEPSEIEAPESQGVERARA
jgi:hypothetical protein